MTPTQYIDFTNEQRNAFFKAYPQPSKSGARGYWKQMLQHAHNAIEDNDWKPETFINAKDFILRAIGDKND